MSWDGCGLPSKIDFIAPLDIEYNFTKEMVGLVSMNLAMRVGACANAYISAL